MNYRDTINKISGRSMISVIGLVGWSAAMILVGSLSSEIGFSESQAAGSKQLVRLDSNRLAGNNIGEYAPYHPEAGNLVARGHEYFYSEDGNMGIGVWESKPGEMTYTDLAYDELMYVLDGSIIMTDEDGHVETFTQGQGLVLPKGWSGTLGIGEDGVRKIWVSYMGGEK